MGHTVCYFTRRAAIQNWTKDTKETYFVISDVKRGIKYQIKLFMGSDQIKDNKERYEHNITYYGGRYR